MLKSGEYGTVCVAYSQALPLLGASSLLYTTLSFPSSNSYRYAIFTLAMGGIVALSFLSASAPLGNCGDSF